MRTKHTPSDYKEQCYTCKREFESYFHLMNHRKTEHPLYKVCCYFRKKVCIFEAGECWYSHGIQEEDVLKENDSKISCNGCEKEFVQKQELMKHTKKFHPSTVAKCRNYKTGKCNLTDELLVHAWGKNKQRP